VPELEFGVYDNRVNNVFICLTDRMLLSPDRKHT